MSDPNPSDPSEPSEPIQPAQPATSTAAAFQPAAKNFFAALFDFRFTTYVTPKVVSVLYVLGMVGIALLYVSWVVTASNASAGFGLLVLLVIGPIVAVLLLTFLRVTLEFYLAMVRLSEDFRRWSTEWRDRAGS